MMGTTLIVPRIAGKKCVMVGGHRQTGVHSNDRKAGFLIKSKQWIREMSGEREGCINWSGYCCRNVLSNGIDLRGSWGHEELENAISR